MFARLFKIGLVFSAGAAAAGYVYSRYKYSYRSKIIPFQIPTHSQMETAFGLNEKAFLTSDIDPMGILIFLNKKTVTINEMKSIVRSLYDTEKTMFNIDFDPQQLAISIYKKEHVTSFMERYKDLSYLTQSSVEYLNGLGDKVTAITPSGCVRLCFTTENLSDAEKVQAILSNNEISSELRKIPKAIDTEEKKEEKIISDALANLLSQKSNFFMPKGSIKDSLLSKDSSLICPSTTPIPYVDVTTNNLIGFCEKVKELSEEKALKFNKK